MQKVLIICALQCYQSCDIGPLTFQADYGPFKRAAQLDLPGIKQFHKIFFLFLSLLKKPENLLASLFLLNVQFREIIVIKY